VGMTVGQVDWVAIYGAKGVQWQFGEKPDPQSPIVQDLIHEGELTEDEAENFDKNSTPAWHDLIWTDAAVDILQHHTPNLLLMHLLETDSVQHEYGPLTPAAFAAYAYADSCLRRIVDAARAAAGTQNVTFFVLSDHGFRTYTHVVRPNVLLQQRGLITTAGEQTTGKVWVQAEGGAAEVFIRDDTERAALTTTLHSLFATVKGVQHVYTNKEAQSLDLPALGSTSQAPDLYLTADPDYAFAGGTEGEVNSDTTPKGQHGYDNRDPDMQALFVASGAHIQAGAVVPVFPNLRVAPTIARVLGVTLPDAKQPALDILK
jgi:predicted AlkP superfamily pyrophosphatase or phosphodiesterase